MAIVLPLSAFWITRLFWFFNLLNDSYSFLLKLKGGELSLLKVELDVNTVSCKCAFILAKSTEDTLLDFMSWNKKPNRSRNFEYSVFFGEMATLIPLISNGLSGSVKW